MKMIIHSSLPHSSRLSASSVSLRKRPKKTEAELKEIREKLVKEQASFTRSAIWS